MLKWLIRNRLAAFEKQYDYDASYARHILDTDTRAFFALARLGGLGAYRRGAPAAPYFAARIVGSLSEDCGPCTQLNVTMALRAGAPAGAIAAVLAGDDAAMSDDVRLAVRFARAAIAHDPAAGELRDAVVARWGERGLISLAYAIAVARLYPTIKYALGHGVACQRVIVAGTPVAVARSAA